MQNKKIFLLNLIYYICMLGVAVVFVLGYFDVITNVFLSTFLIQGIVMFAIPTIMYSLLISKSAKQTFSDFGFKKISFKILLISISLGFVLFFINNYVADIFFTVLNLFGYDNSINISLSLGPKIGLEFLLTAIIPGICEEILHRGMFMRGSKKQGFTRYGLLFSSLLFGLIHLNIQQFFYATILGGLMGLVVIASDSIYPAMIIHFMNNALSIYFGYGAKYNWPLARFKATIENIIFSTGLIISIVVICGIITLLLYLYKLLVTQIIKEKHKQIAIKLAKDLKMDNMEYAEVQNKLGEIDTILQQSSDKKLSEFVSDEKTLTALDKLFLYSSLILGGLITLCSFIWGML